MAVSHVSPSFFMLDALRRYTEDFRLTDGQNPMSFTMNGREYSVHVSEIHFAARKNPDEWRIQIPRAVIDIQRARQQAGVAVAFIGFFPDGTVFSAWEPDYVFSLAPEDVGSVYVSRTHWQTVLRDNAALEERRANNLRRMTRKISLGQDLAGTYLENIGIFHAFAGEQELVRAVDQVGPAATTESFGGTAEQEVIVAGQRRTITATRTSYVRDPRFRERVLQAYGGSCCVCGKQLGLVQAAHIIPHCDPTCVEDVTNGLALCIEHHKLYDDALLLPSAGQRFHLNEFRVEHLRNIGQDSGIDAVRALAQTNYRVPDHVPSRPNDDYLERGRIIRLG